MRKSFFFISFLFYSLAAVCQEAKHYNFTHYTGASGLISYQVNSCVQDEDGFIWIATNDGLQRFDGIRYKNFRHKYNDPSSLPSKSIWQLLLDKNKNMWILTVDGKAGIFDRNTFRFRQVTVRVNNESLIRSTSFLKKLITDEFGNMFLLLAGKELVMYNEKKNEFSAGADFILRKPEWGVYDFIQQPGTKKYWMALSGGGFAIYNQATGRLSYAGNNIEGEKLLDQSKGIANPENLFFDKKGRLWFDDMGVGFSFAYCYDLRKQEFILNKYGFSKEVTGNHEIRKFYEQEDGTIWITGIKIFAKYLEKEKKFEHVFNGYVDDRSIDYMLLTCLFEDREHNLWVGTANNGLYRFNPSEEFFTSIKHIDPVTGQTSDAAPVAFMNDKDGSILVGVWGEKLLRYDKSLKEIPLDIKGFPTDKIAPVISMCSSGDSNIIWMATQPKGLYKYDKNRRHVQYFNPASIESRVRTFAEDNKGNLWIGTQNNGVFKWNAAKGKAVFDSGISKFTSVTSDRINKIITDRKGNIWIGTFEEGVYVVDPETGEVIIHLHSKANREIQLPEQTVTSILEYDDTLMVISTINNVIFYNKLQQKISFVSNSEITSGFISSLEKDKNGHVWVSTTAALYRLAVRNKIFVKFNRDDGIRNDYFIIGASHVLPDGRILLGSTATMVAFNPSEVKMDTDVPKIHITGFKVMNRSLRIDSLLNQPMIELDPDENSITIDLSTLSYNTGYLLRYKLEGLDKDWQMADKSQQLIYSYLPPAKYTLLVNTIDAEGNYGKNPLQLYIRVNPPFWKTWWFYSLLALAVAALLFWLDRERMKRKEVILKMRSDIADNLHQQVSTALSNINVLSEMARLKADNEPQKSKEFIDQIHTKSNNMMNAMNDMLWAINPENDSMQKALERIKEHIDSLRNNYGTKIDLLVDKNVESLNLNMKLRQDVFWFFKSGITNITRSGATNCHVHIRYKKPNLVYTIEFDNTHMDMQQMNNLLQRQELDKKIKETNARLNSHLHKTRSVIELTIPVS